MSLYIIGGLSLLSLAGVVAYQHFRPETLQEKAARIYNEQQTKQALDMLAAVVSAMTAEDKTKEKTEK